jgi:hypothetical protein
MQFSQLKRREFITLLGGVECQRRRSGEGEWIA